MKTLKKLPNESIKIKKGKTLPYELPDYNEIFKTISIEFGKSFLIRMFI